MCFVVIGQHCITSIVAQLAHLKCIWWQKSSVVHLSLVPAWPRIHVYGEYIYVDVLVQDCDISITNLLEIPQSCTRPSIYCFDTAPAEVLLLWKQNSYCISIILFYVADANFQIIQTQPWNRPFQPVDIHNITSHKERAGFQYVPRIMDMVRALLCFSVARRHVLRTKLASWLP